ncbi:MAG: MgtC/SapB family protein [Dehalococcoidia bacterium]|nr:MgtC/SapB family protein [Dehalococcoidia bacterium]
MSNADQVELYLWALLALGLGALVGLEREVRGHEAGIRTNALVCGGAAIFGLISNELGDTRIAANIVQGIGFLGAGLVMQRQHMIRGVTTAATVWVMAAVGLLVANELSVTAVLASATVVVLLELAPVSDRVLQWSRRRGTVHEGAAAPSSRRTPG